MTFSYNSESSQKARKLRRAQTEAEKTLWGRVRGRRLHGYKFYRQYPIGSYIVDFYCPEKQLIIELDGSQHLQQKTYDLRRTKYLEKRSLHVLRFWDNELFKNLPEVLETINEKLR